MIKYPYRLNLSKSYEKNVLYRSVLFTKYIINYYSKTEIFINGENRFANDKSSNKQFIYFSKTKEEKLLLLNKKILALYKIRLSEIAGCSKSKICQLLGWLTRTVTILMTY